ncbi:MAG: RNA polymerase sigma factor [Muribaculaceae bacterium]|nr:RNA polymerase sigma factor [Muribaculaceae bacterium]
MTATTHPLITMLRDPAQREQGFSTLLRQHGHALYWHIRRVVVGHDDAEDAFQETCIKLWGGIDKFQGTDEAQLIAWTYTIATREALQLLRRQVHWFQSIDDLSDTLTERMMAETPLDSQAAEVLFQQALLQLPTQQRIAFNLRYYDNLSFAQIAQITGKREGTVKVNYHYAEEKVKHFITQHAQ